MSALKLLCWGFVALLGAGALAIVAGLVSPHEQVNALWLVVAAACLYVLAYRFYGRWIASRVIELNNQRITPAVRLNDGVNFHPTNSVVLFGHHFAAIAGAGPLLGPVLAAQFGFLPGFLWLVIGAVLAGAVQDFVILVASMRRNGRSLPEIARDELGVVTGTATALAVLFIVVVALAGLGFAVVNALYHNAWGTFTIAMTIPIGFVMGFYLQKFRPGAVAEVSFLGVALLIIAVLLGRVVAKSSYASWFEYERSTLGLAAGRLWLSRLCVTRLDALGAPRVPFDLYEAWRRVPSRIRRHRAGADCPNAPHDDVCGRRRPDHSGHRIPIPLYYHRLWSRLRFPRLSLLRHHAEND